MPGRAYIGVHYQSHASDTGVTGSHKDDPCSGRRAQQHWNLATVLHHATGRGSPKGIVMFTWQLKTITSYNPGRNTEAPKRPTGWACSMQHLPPVEKDRFYTWNWSWLVMRAGVAEAPHGLCLRFSGFAIGNILCSQRDGFLGARQTFITGFDVNVNNISRTRELWVGSCLLSKSECTCHSSTKTPGQHTS